MDKLTPPDNRERYAHEHTRNFVVTLAVKIEVQANDPLEARREAVEQFNADHEDKAPFDDYMSSWQTLNVREAREDEREWHLGDYDVNEFGGHIL